MRGQHEAVRVLAIDGAASRVIYFNELDRGNHFAAWQEPDLFTREVRAAFRPLR